MARRLNGRELQDFILPDQQRQVRNFKQEHGITPKLLIIRAIGKRAVGERDVIDTYIGRKQDYAALIGVEVEVEELSEADMPDRIATANADSNIHGIIVQLPLTDKSQTEAICNVIDSKKDVDGLGAKAAYPSATAKAIDLLLTGYDVSLEGKRITILGDGKLVGAPLGKMWRSRGLDVTTYTVESSPDAVAEALLSSDVIVAATGVPRLVKSEQIKHGAVVVDAGTANENGTIVGDVEEAARERADLTITPVIGGVGPMTITTLFGHVLEVCHREVGNLK